MASSGMALMMATVLLMQLVAAGAWALAPRALAMPRRPALYWSGTGLFSAGTMALALLREGGREVAAPALAVSNLTLLGSMLTLVQGMRLFLGLAPRQREALVVLAAQVAVCVVGVLLPRQAATDTFAVGTAVLMLWTLLRGVADARRALAAEFGRATAHAVMAPLLGMATLVALRLAGMAVAGHAEAIHLETPLHVGLSLVYHLMMTLLHLSMAAMVVLRLVASLRELSTHDALTGLVNRGEWLRLLAAQHRWLGRSGEPFSVMVIDIDHFKRVNDTWGHPAGDAVLQGTAQILVASVRGVDTVGRMGGEEFVVLLPAAGAGEAAAAAERMRRSLEGTSFPWKQQAIGITVSVGVATAVDADEPPQRLLERADAALYAAKRGGRNRVHGAEAAAAAAPAAWAKAATAAAAGVSRPAPLSAGAPAASRGAPSRSAIRQP